MNLMGKPAASETGTVDTCSRIADGVAHGANGAVREIAWALPGEVPVAIQINTESFTVMMATPADIRDFAVGIVLSEGLVRDTGDLRGVLVMPVDNGITVDIAVAEGAFDATRMGRRSIEGRTGCGLCGVEDIAGALKPLPRLGSRFTPSPAAILKAARALPSLQPMNLVNRSVHAAAWCSRAGDVLVVREDVGRHNALDKLIGALALAGTDRCDGFVLMTSRCSFELVQKCALTGIGALATVSAPTALALDLARATGLYLAALGRDEAVVFNP
ncbi:MAG TPA: formate dehydrogenase accessory sulfurtransferase FdhD [Hyphomicrobium sp.]|nr:formate dehydrogenase accessory sulfurtransferase FdhD [Hyphomicrobium sp.]